MKCQKIKQKKNMSGCDTISDEFLISIKKGVSIGKRSYQKKGKCSAIVTVKVKEQVYYVYKQKRGPQYAKKILEILTSKNVVNVHASIFSCTFSVDFRSI